MMKNPRRTSRLLVRAVALGFGSVMLTASMAWSGGVESKLNTVCASVPKHGGRVVSASPSDIKERIESAQDGDQILLESGQYGRIIIAGVHNGFVTVSPKPGQTAIFSSLSIKGSHWWIRGITVDGSRGQVDESFPKARPGGWAFHPKLVVIRDSRDVVLENSLIQSVPGDYPWASEQIGADLPVPLYDGVAAMNSTCVEFSHNRIHNIFNAITLDGDQVGDRGHYFRVSYNQIDDFAGDGIDHSVSDALIAHNQITNSHDVCNQKCVHTDGIQGWNHNNQAGIVNYNVDIVSNKIVYRTKSPYSVPNGGLQGITIFDGFWKNVKIANNTVVTNHWHGITIGGVDGLVVENNTVLSVNDRQTWIRVGGETHEGGRSRDVVVRNNIAMQFIAPPPGVPGYVEDHNLSVMDPRSVTTRFDVSAFDFDLHLRPTSEAVGRGASDPRVPVDQEGRARGKSVDMGAFQISP